MKPILQLDKRQIQKKITDGNTLQGSHLLAVAPDGSAYSFHWLEGDRILSPAPPDDWLRIGIPSLFNAGSGADTEMAEDILHDKVYNRDASLSLIGQFRTDDISIIDYIQKNYLEAWNAWIAERLDWYLKAFLAACNGDGTDLNWVYSQVGPDFDYEANEPPATFEYA